MSDYEYIVLGCGPAGAQMGYFLKKLGVSYVVLERATTPGAFFQTFPRHRRLISVNKVFTGYDDPERNLRWDWNSLLSDDNGLLFKQYSRRYFPDADDMVRYLADYVDRYAINVAFGWDVARIEHTDRFAVHAAGGRVLSCDRLVVATGVSREWKPNFPGVELCESYGTVSVTPSDFENQRVLIVGKGNSGFETADNLIETTSAVHLVSPRSIRMAWRSHFVGDLRAVNNNLLDTYQLKLQNAVLDGTVQQVSRKDGRLHVRVAYHHANGEVEALVYDRVILATGFRFDDSTFDVGCKPRFDAMGRFPLQSEEWESVNVPGMYFAGTLMQSRDYKRYMSGFIHGFRYNIRALSRIFAEKYHGVRWEPTCRFAGADAISAEILRRANSSSALWQQPGFLGDIVAIGPGGHEGAYYEEMALDYAAEKYFKKGGSYLAVTLEFGKDKALDPFSIERIHREDTNRAAQSAFLHPVVRRYENGVVTAEHHVIEDLAAEWHEPEHTQPLRAFVEETLLRSGQARDGTGSHAAE